MGEPVHALVASGDLFERVFDRRDDRPRAGSQKIISGGNIGGRMPLAGARRSQRLLLRASVLAAQRLYGPLRDILLVYGKEKVYGSIP